MAAGSTPTPLLQLLPGSGWIGRLPAPCLQLSSKANAAGDCKGWSGTSEVASGPDSPSPLPPQTSVQMLTGVAGLGFRYERQRVRVELLGKRHQESQSLIGIPARDESPRLPMPAKAKRGHWSRTIKATHRRHRGRSPLPERASALGLGCSPPSSASSLPASLVRRQRGQGASLPACVLPGSVWSPSTEGFRGGRLPKASLSSAGFILPVSLSGLSGGED